MKLQSSQIFSSWCWTLLRSRSVARRARIQEFTFSRRRHSLRITIGCRTCTYPSIHFFVSRSRSVARRARSPSIHFFVSRSRSVARRARIQEFVCVVYGVHCVRCGVLSCAGVWVWLWVLVCKLCCVCVSRGTPPPSSLCAGSKRLRVYRQNARMCSTCGRCAGTHGC